MKTQTTFPLFVLIPLLMLSCGKKPNSSSNLADATSGRPAHTDVPPSGQNEPVGLPPCAGLLRVEKESGNSQVGTSSLLSSQPVDKLLNSYTVDLSSDGWILKTSVQQNLDHHLLFLQGDRFLRMQIGPSEPSDGASRILLAWGQTTSTDESQEAYEPEPEEDEPDINRGSVEW